MKSAGFDVLILGAGGAGLMCAATAAARGLRVAVLDHVDQPGKKILISGGGRCNFTNLDARPECYLSSNPHFAKSALKRYPSKSFIDLVNSYGIAWHEKTLGQLFCDGSAKQIVEMLMQQCRQHNVAFFFSETVRSINKSQELFEVLTSNQTLSTPSVVVATGGPSIPKLGATGFAYDIARKFGSKVVEPRPALVPLTLGPSEALFRDLSGLSASIRARSGEGMFEEAALFTHKGLSGPAILQVSSYWKNGEKVFIDFFPDQDEAFLIEEKADNPQHGLIKPMSVVLPDRLSQALLAKQSLQGATQLGTMKDADLRQLGALLKNWSFEPNGSEGFAKAEVTIGGVSTNDLSSKTMESKKCAGLYFIGEGVDVTGWLGGYNFQWAWSSGVAAGEALRGSSE